jgi:hypothetical protein
LVHFDLLADRRVQSGPALLVVLQVFSKAFLQVWFLLLANRFWVGSLCLIVHLSGETQEKTGNLFAVQL